MATYTKINDFLENWAEVIDADNDVFIVALSPTLWSSESPDPTTDTNGILANVSEISYANLSSRTLTLAASSQTAGTYKLDFNDLILTASGAVASYRYVYVYSDTPTSPADPLVMAFDHGSVITLADTETHTITFNAGGLFTIA